jgi:hypothetical protein
MLAKMSYAPDRGGVPMTDVQTAKEQLALDSILQQLLPRFRCQTQFRQETPASIFGGLRHLVGIGFSVRKSS